MILYSSLGVEKIEFDKFTYHGTYMGECYLNADIENNAPIPFEVGDYCIYRGEHFYLNYVPASEKTADKDSRGDAFKYSNIKFNSALDELTRALMLDIVPNDSKLTWTGMPTFNFYASSAQALADRIQANLDSIYSGSQKWTITILDLKDKNGNWCSASGENPIDATISYTGKTVMQALSDFYNIFNLNYIVRDRVITIGTIGQKVGATFGYGEGNGLYDILQTTKTDALLITRLFVYGSTTNISTKYYSNLTGHGISSVKKDGISYQTVRFTFNGEYSEAGGWAINLNGAPIDVDINLNLVNHTGASVASRIALYLFDGWTVNYTSGNDYVEFVCNTIGRIEIDNFSSTGITSTISIPSYGSNYYETIGNSFWFSMTFPNNISYFKNRISENLYGVKFKYSGYEINGFVDTSGSYAKGYINNTETNYNNFKNAILSDDTGTIQITDGLFLDLLPYAYVEFDTSIPDNLAVTNLMLPDFPKVKNNPNDVYIDSPNISKYGIRQGSVTFDGSDKDHPDIHPTIEDMTAAQIIAAGINLSLKSGDNGKMDQILGCDNPTDNGDIPTATSGTSTGWKSYFTIYIKDLGFDLSLKSGEDYYYAQSTMQISMKSGTCTGRTFDITKVEKDTSLGYIRYVLTCNRNKDTNINKAYPYTSDYEINANDIFVLLGIKLPDVYVKAASQKLLTYGNAYLAKNDETKYTYTPKVNEIFMANHPDIANSIKEGDLFDFSDTDLNISGLVFIKSLTITEGVKSIPSYDIVLDDDVEASTLEKIQNNIDKISGSLGTSTADVYYIGNKNYISKTDDDTAEGHITFNNGITVKDGVATDDLEVDNEALLKKGFKTDNFVSGMAGRGGKTDEKGNGEFESIRVRSYFEAMEYIVNRLSAIEGDQLLTEADTIESVDDLGNSCYGLHLRSKWDGYFTAQAVNNVLKGIINTLSAGSGTYYTSWFRVNSVNTANNYIEVTQYPDADTPAGKNYPPVAMMKIARWGNQTDTTRQSCLYLSSTEGRIVKLTGVTKPIIDKTNFGAVLGTPPDFLSTLNLPLRDGRDYMYIPGIITTDMIRIDYQGAPVSEYVDRGAWSATGSYYHNAKNPISGMYEISDVWYNGCKYRCQKTGTTTAPAWNNTDWAMVEGNPDFTVDFAEIENIYDPDNFNTTLTIVAKLYNIDITADILPADVAWTRYSEDADGVERTASDNAWALRRANSGKSISLTIADCDINGYMPKKIRFTATVTLRDGTGNAASVQSISYEY